MAGYDTVTALVESEATGKVAEVLADIRATMQIPLVTSIWRVLAAVDGGLDSVWQAVKPLHASGAPDAALNWLHKSTAAPTLAGVSRNDLSTAGVATADLPAIRRTIAAYNRSNGLNLVTLSALLESPSGEPFATGEPPPLLPAWGPLPTLLDGDDISTDTWALLRDVNRFGVEEPQMIGTLWRHLAHWPGLLQLAADRMVDQQRDGSIPKRAEEAVASARQAGTRLAHLRAGLAPMPDAARQIITAYVREPEQLARMVSIGQSLATWFDNPT